MAANAIKRPGTSHSVSNVANVVNRIEAKITTKVQLENTGTVKATGMALAPLNREGKNLSEKKIRRLEKNRLSARNCRRKKKEYTQNLQREMNILEGENLRLRLQLQVCIYLNCQTPDAFIHSTLFVSLFSLCFFL